MRRRLLVFLVVVIVLAAVIYAASRQGGSDKVEIGSQAPDFTLTDVAGNVVKLSDFRGKPVFLNFWTSWCGPCRQELPAIQQLYEDKQGSVVVITVNLTYTEESADKIKKFVTDSGFTMPVLLDLDGEVGNMYQIGSIPLSLYLDDQGVVRRTFTGAMTEEMLEVFVGDVAS